MLGNSQPDDYFLSYEYDMTDAKIYCITMAMSVLASLNIANENEKPSFVQELWTYLLYSQIIASFAFRYPVSRCQNFLAMATEVGKESLYMAIAKFWGTVWNVQPQIWFLSHIFFYEFFEKMKEH